MKKKGFTLIELLAVIVILAIIALIATPIVMNTIENAEKGAAERSADNYIDTVETEVAKQRIDNVILEGEYTIQSDGSLCPVAGCGEDDKDKVSIEMSGDKPSSGTIKISNGLVTTESTMTVGDYTVSYNSDTKQLVAEKEVDTTTIVYRWSEEDIKIGDTMTSNDYVIDAATLGKKAYLKHVLDKDNKVIESYACGIFNDNEYCVRGGNEEYYGSQLVTGEYTGNLSILKSLEAQDVSCSLGGSLDDKCGDPNNITLYVSSYGYVKADANSYACYVNKEGISGCTNQRPGIW